MISGLGFQELFLILALILIVFGPRRLPELMRYLGRITREFRRIAWEFRSALELESLNSDTRQWTDDVYADPETVSESKSDADPDVVSEPESKAVSEPESRKDISKKDVDNA